MQDSRNAENIQNFPTVPGQLPPFEQLLKNLKVDTGQVVEPEFNFEFIGITPEEVERHCATANLNFMTFTDNRGIKLYYNANYDIQNPRWIETSRPDPSDVQQELSQLIYLDRKNQIMDWRTTLDNLKRLSLDYRYTEQMMHACLLKIINKLLPEQTLLVKHKTYNEIAQFLLKLDSKVDKLSFYREQLFVLQRNTGEELDSVMARLGSLLDKIYPPANPETMVYRENILKTAIVSFIPDEIAVPLLEDIKHATKNCNPMPYERILSIARAAERYAQFYISNPIVFGRD